MYEKIKTDSIVNRRGKYLPYWKMFTLIIIGLIVGLIGYAAFDLSTVLQYFKASTSDENKNDLNSPNVLDESSKLSNDEVADLLRSGSSSYQLNTIFGIPIGRIIGDSGLIDDNIGKFVPEKMFMGFKNYYWMRTPKTHIVYTVSALDRYPAREEAENVVFRAKSAMEDKYGTNMLDLKKIQKLAIVHNASAELKTLSLLFNQELVHNSESAYGIFFGGQVCSSDVPNAKGLPSIRTIMLFITNIGYEWSVCVKALDLSAYYLFGSENKELEMDAL